MKSNNIPVRGDNTKLLNIGPYKCTMLIKQGKFIVISNATYTMDI